MLPPRDGDCFGKKTPPSEDHPKKKSRGSVAKGYQDGETAENRSLPEFWVLGPRGGDNWRRVHVHMQSGADITPHVYVSTSSWKERTKQSKTSTGARASNAYDILAVKIF